VAKISATGIPWEDILIWTGLLLLLHALHDVFSVVFLTFLLTYLVRTIVIVLARRIDLDRERPALERWLTFGTFLAIAGLIWGLAALMVPQFVLQARLLTAQAERVEPRVIFDHFLARTVGAYLFHQTYGNPGDPRYEAAFEHFTTRKQAGEGAYASFGHLEARVQAGFEIAYEAAARARLRHQIHPTGDPGPRFDHWFLAVKAPALVAERRTSYLARLPKKGGRIQAADTGDLEHRLGELALKDLDADPAERARLVAQWDEVEAAEQWRRLRESPEYRQAFAAWFNGPQGMAAEVPYDAAGYLALRDAYAEGMGAFKKVYQTRVAQTPAGVAMAQLDFQRATELDLARQWWAESPVAASLREHLKQDAVRAASAVSERLATALRALISIPAQVGTALLLTILISFNTLLTFALMRLLGLHNELLLCAMVFIASLIPVLGIILSAIPIGLQALLQPDGSLDLALYALLGIGAIHAFESMVLSPKIVGKILHLHPVLVLAVLVIGEHLFGIWGLLLGVPLAVYAIHVGILAERIPGIYEPPQTSES
jgi:predicted PurR-regulated permease PerM